jgi:hypothetical protein
MSKKVSKLLTLTMAFLLTAVFCVMSGVANAHPLNCHDQHEAVQAPSALMSSQAAASIHVSDAHQSSKPLSKPCSDRHGCCSFACLIVAAETVVPPDRSASFFLTPPFVLGHARAGLFRPPIPLSV